MSTMDDDELGNWKPWQGADFKMEDKLSGLSYGTTQYLEVHVPKEILQGTCTQDDTWVDV